jgi:pimeloyl-ACP methyl ester carboxylesterase
MRKSFPVSRRRFLQLAAAAVGGLSVSPAPAQPQNAKPRILAYFKDGFAIEGYVKRESVDIEIDDYAGVGVPIYKGFFLLDDGPRRIVFPQTQIGHIQPLRAYAEEVIEHKKNFPTPLTSTVPDILDVKVVEDFNKEWTRTVQLYVKEKADKGPRVRDNVVQHIGRMTPYTYRVDNKTAYNFASAFLTRELPLNTLSNLVAIHPNYAENRDMSAEEHLKRRYAYAEFMAQAGYTAVAEDILQGALREFPGQKAAIEERLSVVGELSARDEFENIKRLAIQAGQHQVAMKRIESFPEKYANEKMLSQLRGLKADYDTAMERGKEAFPLLGSLAKEVGGDHAELLREAALAIQKEVCYDNINRLETFVVQAKQYERLKKDGKKPEVGPGELLALAASSWLLGNAAGDTKPDTAARLWKLRKLILECEKAKDVSECRKLVADATKDGEDLRMVEEAWQMVSNLPPAEPAEITPQIIAKTQEVKAGRKTTYQLQLPPEYRHGRHYPVLIVLHASGEKPREMIDRWRDSAADNGYILAAPEWEDQGKGYSFSEEETQTVIDTVRDLRRRFHVDSDRVFLFGLRDGGTVALDVGTSHPDLFAGVSTMGAGPEKYAEVCALNAKHLPFYVVNGDRAGPMTTKTHRLFEQWVSRDCPSLWVSYKGRGAEWFAGEVPMIFEWMSVKRRAFPLHNLNTGMTTQRASDNSFYWLTIGGMSAKTAVFSGTINPDNNDIRVGAKGVSQLSVWLGRNLRGEGMIDFTKPVTLRVETAATKQMVKPSLKVMLEDLYLRGDRQRVYMARLDWSAPR